MTTPQNEVDDLLLDLDAEFGKKAKAEKDKGAKALNRAFHQAHPQATKGAPSYARAQLEKGRWENYYDWETHRIRLLEEAQASAARPGQDAQLPDLEWYPQARVTYVVRQTCATCRCVVEFVGTEYVQFRGRRREFHELGGGSHQMTPMVLQRADRVDPNLLAFGLPSGDPLPDLVEELQETVRRCAGCIAVERQALDLWVAVTQPGVQDELPGFEEALGKVENG